MKSPFPKTTYRKNAHIYKILANPKRLEILNLIKHKECPVDDIVKVLGVSKANASQHLAILRNTGIVIQRRHGLYMYYSIVDPRIVEPCKVLHNLRHKHQVV